jgi:hypothetical protein
MNRLKWVLSILSLVLLALAIPSMVNADAWDKITTVTFNAPVEIPGVDAQILPAGTYVFKILNFHTNRNVVQIFSQDQTHVFATILTISNFRLRTTDKTVMTFRERAVGSPEAIRAWFYPGLNYGQEFVYPKKRAIELAKITNEPVLAMPAELATNITTPVKSADEPPVVALKEAPVTAIKPTGEEVALSEVVEPPPVETAAVTPLMKAKRLPETASPFPLLELIGLLSLGAGVAILTIRKKSA